MVMEIKTLSLILTLTFHVHAGHHAKRVWHVYQSHINNGECAAHANELLGYARHRVGRRGRVEGTFECRAEDTVES